MKKSKKLICLCLAAAAALTAAACGKEKNAEGEQVLGTADEKTEFVPETAGVYEAEEAVLSGNVKAVSGAGKTGFGGSGYVEGFWEDTDTCTFTVEIKEEGFYDLNFVSASSGGEKLNYVSLDGEQLGTVSVEKAEFTDSILSRVFMTAGTHEVTMTKYWGWIYLDKLEILTAQPIDEKLYQADGRLCNPDASEETKRLYSYLCDIYGTKFLSGQNCDTGQYGKEFQIIKNTTGRTPAVLGLDFIEYSPSRAENGSKGYSTQYAIDFWNSGGIVTFCWHWNAPSKYLTGQWYSGFYKEHTNIDLAKIMNGEDEEGYELLMRDIDVIAGQLLILQDEGVPVLFRPLHEAAGGWFWWGNAGAEAYKKLYVRMYEKLTAEYGLNNLIWVWNGQDADWYPGDEYVDIIGEDIYPGEKVYTSQAAAFLNAAGGYSTSVKPVYMTENGCIFDPELAKRDGAMWGMWCTWGGEFVAKETAIYTLSEQYTEKDMLIKAYSHEDVLTLEDLPDFSTYPVRE